MGAVKLSSINVTGANPLVNGLDALGILLLSEVESGIERRAGRRVFFMGRGLKLDEGGRHAAKEGSGAVIEKEGTSIDAEPGQRLV